MLAPYLPYSYSGVSDKNEQNDERFNECRHGARLVFVFFEQGEDLKSMRWSHEDDEDAAL